MGCGVERMCHKAGLAKQETKDSKQAGNYCGCCHGGRNSQSHTREFIGKSGYSGVRQPHCYRSDPSPTDNAITQKRRLPCLGEYLRPHSLKTEQVH